MQDILGEYKIHMKEGQTSLMSRRKTMLDHHHNGNRRCKGCKRKKKKVSKFGTQDSTLVVPLVSALGTVTDKIQKWAGETVLNQDVSINSHAWYRKHSEKDFIDMNS